MRIIIVTLALLSGAVFFQRRECKCAGLPNRPEGDGAMHCGPQTAVRQRQACRTKLPQRQEDDGTLHTVTGRLVVRRQSSTTASSYSDKVVDSILRDGGGPQKRTNGIR
jgi:hypothetical protein